MGNTEVIEINENFRYEGVDILRCRIRLFYPANSEAIGGFYRTASENAFVYVKDNILKMAETGFTESTDEKKKFRFSPFIYRLCGEVTLDGELFSQRVDAHLRAGKDTLCCMTDGHVWQKRGELLLPPRLALKKQGFPVPKGGCESVLLYESDAIILRNGKWQSIDG